MNDFIFYLFSCCFLFRKKIRRVFFVQVEQKLHAVGIAGKKAVNGMPDLNRF